MIDALLRGFELRSRIASDGRLTIDLKQVEAGEPGLDEVVVRVEAAPINPSDIGLLLDGADIGSLQTSGTRETATLTAHVPDERLRRLRGRWDVSTPLGGEGAGVVVKAGDNVRHLLGKTVAMIGGGMYTQFRRIAASSCVVLPDGVAAADGASFHVNPLTVLVMVETVRAEGHKAVVHTAAASSLGQMLNRVCAADGVGLVNIVRSVEQLEMVRSLGARYVVNSESSEFLADLTDSIAATGATIAFDAIGGGGMANTILQAMEAAANRRATSYSRYGSTEHKQVYIYGALNPVTTVIDRTYGFSWGVSGFLLTPALSKLGEQGVKRLKERVVAELKATFAIRYSHTLSLFSALELDNVKSYIRPSTGAKYLINPNLEALL